MDQRFGIVGPVLRALFKSPLSFESYVDDLKEKATNFFDIKNKFSSIYNIPAGVTMLIGPFVISEDASSCFYGNYYQRVDGLPNFCIRALSPYIARLLASNCDSHAKYDILKSGKLTYQIQESVVEYGLGSDVGLQSTWAAGNWKVYNNKTVDGKFSSFEMKHEVWSEKTIFESMSLNIPIDRLRENVMYCSGLVNGELFDKLQVKHATAASRGVVNMYQASSLSPNQHSLKMELICHVLRNMKIFEKGYIVNYVYCTDASTGLANGYEIKVSEAVVSSSRRKYIPPSEGELAYVRSNFNMYIARIPYYGYYEVLLKGAII
jgi:hypothetical protein